MAISVRIPTPLRPLTQNQEVVQAQGSNVGEVLDALEASFPGIGERLCDEKGELRRFVNIYLNDEDIRFKEGKDTVLKEGDELSIIPAIAGG